METTSLEKSLNTCGSLSFLLRTVISLKAQRQWHNKIGTNQQETLGTRVVNGL